MKPRDFVGYIIVVIAVGILGLGCSLNISSGTGVGNPGKTMVTVIADTGIVRHDQFISSPHRAACDKKIPIKDVKDLTLLVKSVSVLVQKIYFIRADDDDRDYETLIQNNRSLEHDSNEIVLTGPFTFDALNGTVSPPIDTFGLPEGRYKGMRIHVCASAYTSDTGKYAITMEGEFVYKETQRTFLIKLSYDEIFKYLRKGPPFSITEDDSTQFLLLLNAETWLEQVDIKSKLDSGEIQLHEGNLVIDDSVDKKIYKELKKAVWKNIKNSGILVITTLGGR